MKKKFSKIENCSMKMIGNMGFRMLFGGCNTFVSNNEEFVLLCFSDYDYKTCYRWEEHFVQSKVPRIFFFRFDGTNFSSSKSTTYSHSQAVGMGNYRGQPFITGGIGTTDTEILTISTESWRSGTRYPYSNQ